MTRPIEERAAFRCAIAPEDSAARIKISGRWYDCAVVNASRDGFGVRLPSRLAKTLRISKRIELKFRSERWEVLRASEYFDTDDLMIVGLLRVRELTRVRVKNSIGLTLVPKFSADTDPSFLLALVVAFLVTCVCLPGIGSHLGTAPKVRDGVNSVVQKVIETIN